MPEAGVCSKETVFSGLQDWHKNHL